MDQTTLSRLFLDEDEIMLYYFLARVVNNSARRELYFETIVSSKN